MKLGEERFGNFPDPRSARTQAARQLNEGAGNPGSRKTGVVASHGPRGGPVGPKGRPVGSRLGSPPLSRGRKGFDRRGRGGPALIDERRRSLRVEASKNQPLEGGRARPGLFALLQAWLYRAGSAAGWGLGTRSFGERACEITRHEMGRRPATRVDVGLEITTDHAPPTADRTNGGRRWTGNSGESRTIPESTSRGDSWAPYSDGGPFVMRFPLGPLSGKRAEGLFRPGHLGEAAKPGGPGARNPHPPARPPPGQDGGRFLADAWL